MMDVEKMLGKRALIKVNTNFYNIRDVKFKRLSDNKMFVLVQYMDDFIRFDCQWLKVEDITIVDTISPIVPVKNM